MTPTPTKVQIELKQCPLCGGKAEFLSQKFNFLGSLVGINCTECDLWLDCREKTKEGAAEIWNNRPFEREEEA